MRVIVDIFEERSGVPALLEELGVDVERRRLQAGDYVCGPGTIVERKSVSDLHGSIGDGGFWPQMGRIRDAAQSPFLLIEGPDPYRGPIDAKGVRGVLLATTDVGIDVIHAMGTEDTARWLVSLATRRQIGLVRDRPTYAQRPKRRRDVAPAEAALAAAPGISVITARSLLASFGSLRSVVLGEKADWQRVVGVGPGRAIALDEMINRRWSPNPRN